MPEPSYEELKARLAELEKQQGRRGGSLEFRVSEKGGVSVYGLGRFPDLNVGEAIQRLPGSGCASGEAASEAVMAARLSACPPAVAVAAVPRPVTAIVSRQGTS